MATQQTATINITNNTDGNAWIALWHNNSSNGTRSGSWPAEPGATVGPLTVQFETGLGTEGILDYWSVILIVEDGSTPGQYVSSGTLVDPHWKECQLQHGDAGQTITLGVSTTSFDVALKSGGCTGGMTAYGPTPASGISHVFVVMLENHSFDNMFALSGIPGLTVATTSDSNSYDGVAYPVRGDAPSAMPTDPGHEFDDVVEQLAGAGASFPSGGPYPAIDNSGFAASYATTTSEGPTPPAADIGAIMAVFDTATQLPVIYELATQFAICDHWYASMPGPTWPNRFFIHGASSAGLDDSPTTAEIAAWETVDGFTYEHGSIYQALDGAGIQYRLYNDCDTSLTSFGLSLYSDDPQNGSRVGAVPQVSALHGVDLTDINSLEHFASDLAGPYPYAYTFIEPHYGDITSGSYQGGSSQHPMDDTVGGENLLQAVYQAIRNSPYWGSSLLIITYDEHGGFYDSVAPVAATEPGDTWTKGLNTHGFPFDLYGVRVPAVVVSPLVPAGTVDHTVRDHTSALATIERMWNLASLTQRDLNAQDLRGLLVPGAPRTDCPTTLPDPPRSPPRPRAADADAWRAATDPRPLPPRDNLWGHLFALARADARLSEHSPEQAAAAHQRVRDLRTRGEARAYVDEVMQRLADAARRRPKPPRRT